jgi:uncharacterized protein (DUF58 family)
MSATFRPSFVPEVAFTPELARRLEVWAARHAAARRRPVGGGSEGPGRGAGAGYEFLGYRAYQPGDELRQLDWDLYARFERAYVRVLRPEAGERWRVLLDCSASMGVAGCEKSGGEASKLQRACETAAALVLSGVLCGARVELVAAGAPGTTGAGIERRLARKRADLAAALDFLAARRAAGGRGLAPLCSPGLPGRPARLFLLGDLFDLEPRAVAPLARRPGTRVAIARILAAHELAAPPAVPAIEWLDPETGARRMVEPTLDVRRGYERTVAAELEAWRAPCARHGIAVCVVSTRTPFETIAERLL